MRIHLLSDLHLEFGRTPELNTPECDVVVLSGDISAGVKGVLWAKETFKVPVIYVPGNHEYYRGIIPNTLKEMRTAAYASNVFLLSNNTAVIDGVRFIGTTLWTDYNLFGNRPLAMSDARMCMNDHRLIRTPTYQKFLPEMAYKEHMDSVAYLKQAFLSDNYNTTVVVTHHAPSELSVNHKYKTDRLTPAFASNLDLLIEDAQPVLWTHGHMHDAVDYKIGKTRVVCNPYGYPAEAGNNGFRKDLVIEV